MAVTMAVTISDRFVQEVNGTIWDNKLSKRYHNLDQIFTLIQDLNNNVFDFEEEITRQSEEISVLIGEVEEDGYR